MKIENRYIRFILIVSILSALFSVIGHFTVAPVSYIYNQITFNNLLFAGPFAFSIGWALEGLPFSIFSCAIMFWPVIYSKEILADSKKWVLIVSSIVYMCAVWWAIIMFLAASAYI
jgi:magnesium-transporting ATPase (P-type)